LAPPKIAPPPPGRVVGLLGWIIGAGRARHRDIPDRTIPLPRTVAPATTVAPAALATWLPKAIGW
jgi:hypothetical protein